METRIPPDSKPALQCEKLAIQIWFENDAKRGLVYVSEALGSAAENLKKEDRQVRSPVRVQKAADGSDGRSIVIQYDGETRLDDKGKPVVWVLVMPDRETFLWHRVDWPFGAFTPPSRRCPARNLVG
jgi:hypothetical protein